MVAIVGKAESAIGHLATTTIVYGDEAEEVLGMIPSATVVAQESVVNALVAEIVDRRGMTRDDFRYNHPGGALGTTTTVGDRLSAAMAPCDTHAQLDSLTEPTYRKV